MKESIEFQSPQENILETEESISLLPQENIFLSEKDKEVMRAGMYKLKQFFEETPPEKFPAVITFFDLSARPLFYFLKPLIEQEYSLKGVLSPKYRFFSNFSEIEKYEDSAGYHSFLKSELEESKSKNERSLDKELLKDLEIEAYEGNYPTLDLSGVEMEYDSRIQRLRKIFSLSNNGSILFIDDFVNNGGTLKSLNRTINDLIIEEELMGHTNLKISPDLITFFTFYVENREKYTKRNDKLSSKFKVIEGMSGEDYHGFKYRDTSAFSPDKRMRYQKDKESIAGVKKTFSSINGSKRAENRNSEGMSQLRKTMSALGKQILKDLNKK